MSRLLRVAPLFLLAACGWQRSTGDLDLQIRDAAEIEVAAERVTLRFLNRGVCPVEVTGAGAAFTLKTAEDREVVLAGSAVVTLTRKGTGEGKVEVHFVAEGRRAFVHLR